MHTFLVAGDIPAVALIGLLACGCGGSRGSLCGGGVWTCRSNGPGSPRDAGGVYPDAGGHSFDAEADAEAAPPEPEGKAAELYVGATQGCVQTVQGAVYCWFYGSTPTHKPALDGLKQIALGDYSGCGIKSDGSLVCWGFNGSGQLGLGTKDGNVHDPTPVPGLEHTLQVAMNESDVCAVRDDHRVLCWGENSGGQAGPGTPGLDPTPALIPGLDGATQVALGKYHVCALKSDGTVWCWGSGGYGQLGIGATLGSATPRQVVGLTGVQSIASGWYWTCAVPADKSLHCWGADFFGQLGLPPDIYEQDYHFSSPQKVPGISDVAQVAGGGAHTCARLGDASLWCWGQPAYGKLGDGYDAPYGNGGSPPGRVPLTDVAEVGLGSMFSCALRGKGTVWCWGQQGYLGTGGDQDEAWPVQVTW